MKTIRTLLIAICLLTTNIMAQSLSPFPLPALINGTGIYAGLKKCPRPCPTAVGNFYVSDINDNNGNYVKWFTNTSNFDGAVSDEDGLLNTKMALKWTLAPYSIDIDASGLPDNINAANHTGIKTPVGAIEACFRKNYNNDGIKYSDVNPTNMWYLPAKRELGLIKSYTATLGINCFVAVFLNPISQLTGNYWSSTGGAGAAFAMNFFEPHCYFIGKEAANYVRCIRRDDSMGLGTISSINCPGSVSLCTDKTGNIPNNTYVDIPYTGGNGGSYNLQAVSSSGVTGLTATLQAGLFANGNGSLRYYITGTPSGEGTASFAINIGGKTCTLNVTVCKSPAVTQGVWDQRICPGSTGYAEVVGLNSHDLPSGCTIKWSIAGGSGSIVSGQGTQKVGFTVNTYLSLLAVVTNQCGCKTELYFPEIGPVGKPEIKMTAMPNPVCKGGFSNIIIDGANSHRLYYDMAVNGGSSTHSSIDCTLRPGLISVPTDVVGQVSITINRIERLDPPFCDFADGTTCTVDIQDCSCNDFSLTQEVIQPTCKDRSGYVNLSGWEGKASIYLDGEYQDNFDVPCKLWLNPGTHTIRVVNSSGCYKDITVKIKDVLCSFDFSYECGENNTTTMKFMPGCVDEKNDWVVSWNVNGVDNKIEYHGVDGENIIKDFPAGRRRIYFHDLNEQCPDVSYTLNVPLCMDGKLVYIYKPDILILRDIDCFRRSIDIRFIDLPESGWRITDKRLGVISSGNGTSTFDYNNLHEGDYNFQVYDNNEELISSIPLLVDCLTPIPGIRFVRNADCTGDKTADLQLYNLPSQWFMRISDFMDHESEGASTFNILKLPEGSHSIDIYNSKGGTLIRSFPIYVDCNYPTVSYSVLHAPVCGNEEEPASVRLFGLPDKWFVINKKLNLSIEGEGNIFDIANFKVGDYTLSIYDSKDMKTLITTLPVSVPCSAK